MSREHQFKARIQWTGNTGSGTTRYDGYSRDHTIQCEGKPDILSSSAPVFRGDEHKYNPEDLLVASLSSCHMLWYLHLCADSGVNVLEYADYATGIMITEKGGIGKFSEVTLNPQVVVSEPSMIEKAIELHQVAHQKCFIANSVNFPVLHQPVCTAG